MNSGMFEITHDSLAAKIWEKVSAEEKTLMEVKNFITNSAAIYRSRKVFLTKQDLAYIAPYENKLTLDDETLAFINRSKKYYRNGRLSVIATVLLIMGALLVGIIITTTASRKAKRLTIEAVAARKMANKNEELAKKKSDSLSIQTNIANSAVNERQKALDILQTANETLKQQTLELLNEKNLTATQKKQIQMSLYAIKEQEEDTRQTLENTKLLKQNPTEALNLAIDMYDDINENLKGYLKKNAFDAFKDVIYTHDTSVYEIYEVNGKDDTTYIRDVSLTNDNNLLIADGTKFPKIWNRMTGTMRKLLGPLDTVTAIVTSPESNKFITVENKRNLIFWKNYNYVDTANFEDEIIKLTFINHSKEVLIGFRNGNIAVTDSTGKKVRWIINDKKMDIEELVVGKTTNFFVTRSSDDRIRFWLRKTNSDGTTKTFQDSLVIDGKRSGLNSITAMALSSSDELFVATESGLYSATGKPGENVSIRMENKFSSIMKMGFTNKNRLILLTKTNNAFFYDTDKKISGEIKGYDPGIKINNLITFPFDRHFVTIADKRSLKVWDSEVSNSWFYRSLDNNNLRFDEANFAYRWKLKDVSGNLIDTVSFIGKRKNSDLYNDVIYTQEIIWDSILTRPDSLILSSPITPIDGINFYESINIIENTDTLNVKIADLVGGGGKRRNKLDVQSAIISTCRKYVLVIIVDRDGTRSYYIHPTFAGLSELVKSKNLYNIK